MDSDSEAMLISLISQLLSIKDTTDSSLERVSKFKSLSLQIISHVMSMDMEPETKLMSLVTQAISVFNSMDLVSLPKPLPELISLTTQLVNSIYLDSEQKQSSKFGLLVRQTCEIEPEPELISLIYQIFSLVISKNPKWTNLISLRPQLQVIFWGAEFRVNHEEVSRSSNNKWKCLPLNWRRFSLAGKEATHFLCQNCNGKNHEEEYEQAPVEVKHPLHPKHSLQLVLLDGYGKTRECYCCNEDLKNIFYYCSACDYAMNIACVEKPPVLVLDLPKWHDHTLALFPRTISVTCNICALADSSFAIYLCPPCDFVIHRKCLNLPRVIRISRHHHPISFTPSFDQEEGRSCGVCRKMIDTNYGGYSCIKDSCSYAAHSRCATQSNVWDGIELEGGPEDSVEEVLEPFVRIRNGIIQHFSHQHHHLKLDENTGRDYDENKLCQACITPIYFGNFYSCMECDFILHEECANLSLKVFHPIHPHPLTLVGGYDGVMNFEDSCSACDLVCTCGFFYECGKEECWRFKLHVQCATISEPLLNGSHMHLLFLTSKSEEQRTCSVCKYSIFGHKKTFNCLEEECDFALCFVCATFPQKVRYTDDKHILTLSYGDETSTKTYWCEACKRKINPKERFYKCYEYCCVTLHIECLIGKDLYMKPGSSWLFEGRKINVLPNDQLVSRPICSNCQERCPYKIFFMYCGFTLCSISCIRGQIQ